MRLFLICTLLLLTSCGSFLRSGSRGSLSDATEKSQNEDREDRKVGHDYGYDPEYRSDYDPYTTNYHYDYSRDTIKSDTLFDYQSAGKPQYKSKTRDSLLTLEKEDSVSEIDSSMIVSLKGIDLGIDTSTLRAPKKTFSDQSNTKEGSDTLIAQKKAPVDSSKGSSGNKKERDKNVVFGVEADPQLLLSKNFSKAIGGNIYIGGALNNERRIGGKRQYIFGKIGYHQYRIGSDDSLLNEFKYNELNSFFMGVEYMRYFGAIDNPVAAPYFITNGSFEVVTWDYVNPLIDSVTNEEIDDDALSGFSLGSGAGITFMNTSPVRIGMNLTAGFRFYGLSTVEEFDNDLFKPELYLKGAIKLWVDLGFKDNKKGRLRK